MNIAAEHYLKLCCESQKNGKNLNQVNVGTRYVNDFLIGYAYLPCTYFVNVMKLNSHQLIIFEVNVISQQKNRYTQNKMTKFQKNSEKFQKL